MLQQKQSHQQAHPQMIRRFFQRHKYAGVTLVEVMMLLLILTLALTTLFYTLSQTVSFARDSEARIKATALAREGIEAMYNIRNTNWLRFSSNRQNCWNVLQYNINCVTGSTARKMSTGSYILSQKNDLWILESSKIEWDNTNFQQSADEYHIDIDENGFFVPHKKRTAEEWEEIICKNIAQNTQKCRSIFSRVIEISKTTEENQFQVTSTVYWYNSRVQSVKLQSTITNWKALYN